MRTGVALAALIMVAACSREPAKNETMAVPAPTPAPAVAPAARSAVASAALPAPEMDGVATAAGQWRFEALASGASASFGAGPSGAARFTIRCDPEARQIVFVVPGRLPAGRATIRIVADTGAASFEARQIEQGPRIEAVSPARFTFLTGTLATAQGRIGVKLGAAPTLALPADPAIGEVIRRCARPVG